MTYHYHLGNSSEICYSNLLIQSKSALIYVVLTFLSYEKHDAFMSCVIFVFHIWNKQEYEIRVTFRSLFCVYMHRDIALFTNSCCYFHTSTFSSQTLQRLLCCHQVYFRFRPFSIIASFGSASSALHSVPLETMALRMAKNALFLPEKTTAISPHYNESRGYPIGAPTDAPCTSRSPPPASRWIISSVLIIKLN